MAGTTAVLINKDKRILLEHRDNRTRSYPNRWCIPGGKMEEGETPIDCLIREMREEFNLELDKEKCVQITSYMHDGIGPDYVYICGAPTTDIEINEAQDAKWLTLEEIKQIPLAWEQEKILPVIEDYLSSNIVH